LGGRVDRWIPHLPQTAPPQARTGRGATLSPRFPAVLVSLLLAPSLAAVAPGGPAAIARSADLDAFLAGVAAETVAGFSKEGLTADGLSIAVVDLHSRQVPASGAFRGDAPYYPASVVKVFFLAYYEAEKE